MERNNESWAGFKGELWKKEINVRDFIQLYSLHGR